MDLKKKKVIAREFITLVLCALISIFSYGIIYFNNIRTIKYVNDNFYQVKKKQLVIDSIIGIGGGKHIRPRLLSEVTLDIFGSDLKKDLLKYDDRNQVLILQKNANTQWHHTNYKSKEILSDKQIFKKSIPYIITPIFILFFLRYLIYATIWSIKILRIKSS